MKIATYGKEYCSIDERTIEEYKHIQKIHLIHLNFNNPTEELIERTFDLYPNTKRFFFASHVRLYNSVMRDTSKKYYIENNYGDGIISFFKRNNKCLLNFNKLELFEKDFILRNDCILVDVLKNLEVVLISNEDLQKQPAIFQAWPGNVLLSC